MSDALAPGYEIIDVLGEGGMGRVYRAVHLASGREVALKTLRDDLRHDAARRRLLLDEATAAARLSDPRIVELLDVCSGPDGAPVLVFELVEGHDLERWVAAWPGFARVVAVLDDVLGGLAEAHAAGIVHRDIKPSNILITAEGRAKLADFGIARMLDPLVAGEERGTAGTPAYMAPEQIRPNEPVGPWTDLYALGVIMFQLLTAELPFQGNIAQITIGKLLAPAPEPVPRRGLTLPPETITLMRALLERSARSRPRFASEVRSLFAGLASSVIDAVGSDGPAGATTHHSDTIRSGPLASAVVAATVASDASGVAVTERRSSRPPPEQPTLTSGRAPGASLVRLREVPLVARAEERAELGALVDEIVLRGGSRALVLVGAAGVGKSRLARWGLAEVERRAVMEGVSVGYDATGTALAGGLRNGLRRVLGTSDEPREALRWLDDGRLEVDALAQWLGPEGAAQGFSFDRTLEIAHGALRALSKVRPVYLWIDDAGWSSDGALELVARLLGDPDARVLSIVTMRAGTAEHPRVRGWLDGMRAHVRGHVVEVAAFDVADRIRLLTSIAPFASGVAEDIARAADGTPLQMLHLARGWLEAGLLETGPEGIQPRGGRTVASLLVERPLASLVGHRIGAVLGAMGDRAPVAERVLLRAALLGLRFEDSVLRASCAGDSDAQQLVDAVLDRALLLGVLRFGGDGVYELEHPLLLEHLLDRLGARPDTAQILRATVAAISARYGQARADVGARAAALLRQAGQRDEAWNLLMASILGFSRTSAIAAASEQIAIADRWLDQDAEPPVSRRRFEVRNAESTMLYWGLRYDEGLETLAKARELASLLCDGDALVRCDVREANLRFYKLELAATRALCLELVALEGDGEARLIARTSASDLLAQLATLEGDLEEAQRWSKRFAEYAPRVSEWHARVSELHALYIDFAAGNTEAGAARYERLVARARLAGEVDLTGDLQACGAIVAAALGRFRDARDALVAPIARAVAMGDHWSLTTLLAVAARVSTELDGPEERRAAARRFLEAFDRIPSDVPPTISMMRRLAVRLEELGDVDLASEVRARREARDQAYARGFGRA